MTMFFIKNSQADKYLRRRLCSVQPIQKVKVNGMIWLTFGLENCGFTSFICSR